MSSYNAEPRRSTRNQVRDEKRALEDALALSLRHADGTEDAAVPSTLISRKRKVSEDVPTVSPKKQKTTRSATTSPHGDAGQKSSRGGKAKRSPTNAKVTKEPVSQSVSTTVKQWFQEGLHAGDKDLQVRTEKFAAKEALWIGQVQRGREKDHLIKAPPADMKYVYIRNGQPVLALGSADAPYNPQPRKLPAKMPQKKKLASTPPKKDKPHKPTSLPVAVTDPSTVLAVPNLEFSPHVDGGPLSSDHHSASATRRDLLRPNSSDLVNVPVRNWSDLATSSAMAQPQSSALFPPVQTVRVGFSFGPVSALMQYRCRQHSSNQESATQEEAFAARPSIKILVPDTLKGLLVDDWENITKNNQLVPIPHPTPVSQILEDYVNYEKPQRPENSASIDILEETVAGLKEYFDKSLGRILLYR